MAEPLAAVRVYPIDAAAVVDEDATPPLRLLAVRLTCHPLPSGAGARLPPPCLHLDAPYAQVDHDHGFVTAWTSIGGAAPVRFVPVDGSRYARRGAGFNGRPTIVLDGAVGRLASATAYLGFPVTGRQAGLSRVTGQASGDRGVRPGARHDRQLHGRAQAAVCGPSDSSLAALVVRRHLPAFDGAAGEAWGTGEHGFPLADAAQDFFVPLETEYLGVRSDALQSALVSRWCVVVVRVDAADNNRTELWCDGELLLAWNATRTVTAVPARPPSDGVVGEL